MDWDRLIVFADAHLDGVSTRQYGASLDNIEALQTIAHGRLPLDYLEFLKRMGGESADFPLLPPKLASADVVLAWHRQNGSRARPPPHEYFVFMVEPDDYDGLERMHWAMDLTGPNRTEVALAQIAIYDEPAETPFEKDDLNRLELYLSDHLTKVAWDLCIRHHFQVYQALMLGRQDELLDGVWHRLISVFSKSGFESTLSASSNVWCGVRDSIHVLAHRDLCAAFVMVELRGQNEKGVAYFKALLTDHFHAIL